MQSGATQGRNITLLAGLLKCVSVNRIPQADVQPQHHLYIGMFTESTPVPCELEGMLDALLAVCIVLSEACGA